MSFNLPVFFFFRDTTINPVISFSRDIIFAPEKHITGGGVSKGGGIYCDPCDNNVLFIATTVCDYTGER